MNVRWVFCFTFLLLIHTVWMQTVIVEGVVGQTVVLPCLREQKPTSVYWRYSHSKTVCDIFGGKADFSEQFPAYKDRVNIFEPEIEKGNFSIMLSNVKESDAGTYTCNDPNLKSIPHNVELTIKERQTTLERDETRSTPASTVSPNGERTIRADGLFTLLLGRALLYSLVF